MIRLMLCAFLGGLLSTQSPQASDLPGDIEAGKKISRSCRTCHGKDGIAKIPIAPHIGGETAEYIIKQLQAFKDGSREHEMMTVVVGGLEEQDIKDVASWYASQQIVVTDPKRPAKAPEPEKCVSCHGRNGVSELEIAPHLAGESAIYIATQLKAFRLGKRSDDIMSEIAADMSDEDIRQSAEWYSSFQIRTKPQ